MSFLAPWLLLAAAAIAVPLLLHLLQRSRGRTVSFPAVRYLQRTAREHARSIRARQKLLLYLRILLLVLLALAAARPILTALSSAHPPTALALVVDNTLSSGAVDDGARILDRLLRVGAVSLEAASERDRVWLIRVGEPWAPARPMDPAAAMRVLETVEPTPTGHLLAPAVERAVDLVTGAGMAAAEVHVLSDLQGSAFSGYDPGASRQGSTPVIIWRDTLPPPANRSVSHVLVGGGLPPLPGERAEFVFEVGGSKRAGPDALVRLFAADRLRGRIEVPPGGSGAIGAGPFQAGWVEGSIELDPDALRADDQRFFAFQVRDPVQVWPLGGVGAFLEQALAVLEESGRVQVVESGGEVGVWSVGYGAGPSRGAAAMVIVPPADATLIPGLNRVLGEWGVKWRFEAIRGEGSAQIRAGQIPGLEGVEVWGGYRLAGASGSRGRILAATADGSPWLIEAPSAAGRVLLLGSPLDPSFTSLPVRAGMIPFIDWATTRWPGTGLLPVGDRESGHPLQSPPGATTLVGPDGVRIEIDPTQPPMGRTRPGVYRFLEGDSVVALVAVNPPPGESDLDRAPAEVVRALAGAEGAVVTTSAAWSREIFQARTGPDIGWVVLLLALLVMGLEALVAASGQSGEEASDRGRRKQ